MNQVFSNTNLHEQSSICCRFNVRSVFSCAGKLRGKSLTWFNWTRIRSWPACANTYSKNLYSHYNGRHNTIAVRNCTAKSSFTLAVSVTRLFLMLINLDYLIHFVWPPYYPTPMTYVPLFGIFAKCTSWQMQPHRVYFFIWGAVITHHCISSLWSPSPR